MHGAGFKRHPEISYASNTPAGCTILRLLNPSVGFPISDGKYRPKCSLTIKAAFITLLRPCLEHGLPCLLHRNCATGRLWSQEIARTLKRTENVRGVFEGHYMYFEYMTVTHWLTVPVKSKFYNKPLRSEMDSDSNSLVQEKVESVLINCPIQPLTLFRLCVDVKYANMATNDSSRQSQSITIQQQQHQMNLTFERLENFIS
ncbi:hypothetical protein HELRODRAFT_181248 [Helobdella robusta]|uniref:Uncharacterized protein n=1 Tax=Helobdella robusta TaxID=6412 RepID=T1FGS6_HELRO|nr:hypothetical protein HELRODRAFT_181248 [Helobdella robusta]ESN93141.1 hypothetical protein HELRODRAFT_181248 [Helobdella robusta]